jgi:hypothetical protein
MQYLVPNQQGYWEHKFLHESQTYTKKCILCKRTERGFSYKEMQNKEHMGGTIDLEMGSPLK